MNSTNNKNKKIISRNFSFIIWMKKLTEFLKKKYLKYECYIFM